MTLHEFSPVVRAGVSVPCTPVHGLEPSQFGPREDREPDRVTTRSAPTAWIAEPSAGGDRDEGGTTGVTLPRLPLPAAMRADLIEPPVAIDCC